MQTEQQPQPRVDAQIKGLLQKIIRHESCHKEITARKMHYPRYESVTMTEIEILADGGEVFPVRFNSFVGYELIGQIVAYTQTTYKSSGSGDDITTQELIPENKNLAAYKATEVKQAF